MKKIVVFVAALLVCFVVTAQQSRVPKKLSSSLSFDIGPSFAISDFASNNAGNENAGYAKTGFNLNLNYDYMLTKHGGITLNALYGSNKMDNKIITDFMEMPVPGADITHYQYVGLLVGPVVNGTISPKTEIDFKLLGGIGRARSPQATYQDKVYAKQDWASAFAWRMNSNMHFKIINNTFLMVGLSYTQMRPDFNIILMPNESNTETMKMEMHVNTINLNAGIGIKF